MAMNSARQRSREPKSRTIAAARSFPGWLPSPSPSKNSSCRIIEIGGDKLLALEAVDQKVRSGVEVEPGELFADQIQALHRAAVVILVVADDQLLRHALDVLRI